MVVRPCTANISLTQGEQGPFRGWVPQNEAGPE